MSEVRVKRVYDPQANNDGVRVLMDRLWPRGMRWDEARIDLWLKDVAPSAGLRRWFGHDPVRWLGFQDRYRAELAGNAALDELLAMMKLDKSMTLLFGAHDLEHDIAVALQDFLLGRS